MSKTDNQAAQILAHLKEGKAITPIDALTRFGCFRLGARIFELRQAGHAIETERVETPNGSNVAKYRLVG